MSPRPTAACLLLACAAALAHAASAAHNGTVARVVYSDSKQHVREDWVEATAHSNAMLSLSGEGPSEEDHELLFCVKQRNIDTLKTMHAQISDPASPTYRQYLTFEEVGDLIKNTPATTAVVQWLLENGAAVGDVTPRGEYVRARASVAKWSELLRTDFRLLRHKETNAHVFRCRDYSLPADLAEHVQSVGYTSQLPIRSAGRHAPVRRLGHSNGGGGGVRGRAAAAADEGYVTLAVLQKHYNIDTATAGRGNQSVFESGQYYSESDLNSFGKENGYSHVVVRDINGHKSDYKCIEDDENCIEGNLDVQLITAVSQGVPTNYWYVDDTKFIYYQYLLDVAKDAHPVLVHSISYGSVEAELEQSILDSFDTELLKLGLLGVTVVVSSGDDGVANFIARDGKQNCGYNPSYPASSPYVTAVGATQGIESDSKETACTSATGGGITTGGGFSTHYAQPAWQKKAVSGYFAGLTSGSQPKDGREGQGLAGRGSFVRTNRGYPDVALAGYNYVYKIGGQDAVGSGTSASAPVFAAMVSNVNSALLEAGKPPLGFLNPTLYGLGGSELFNDVTKGKNNCAVDGSGVCCREGFFASRGWDPLTGLGSVDFAVLKAKLGPGGKPKPMPMPAAPTPMGLGLAAVREMANAAVDVLVEEVKAEITHAFASVAAV